MKRVFLGLVFVLLPCRIEAQKQKSEPDSCIYRIPASAFKRVPVFLEATSNNASRGVLPAADLFAQSVAFKIREILGAHDSQLPEADSTIRWSRLGGELLVTVHRNKALTWRTPESSDTKDTIAGSSGNLLVRAIKAAIGDGEFIPFPQGLSSDSVSFSLAFKNPTVTKEGTITPLKSRLPIPVFSIAIAWEKPVSVAEQPGIVYPAAARRMGAIGGVMLVFTVKRNGRVDFQSVKEKWPEGLERPKGEMLTAYDAFVRAVKNGLRTAKYSPALIGGCAVNQRVEQFFEFKIP